MTKPGRFLQRLVWLASLVGCASARPVFEMQPINGNTLNARWPEVLRTRYRCDSDVVGSALVAVTDGFVLQSRRPVDSDRGSHVCELLLGLRWPGRVRAFETDSGILELWEFRGTEQQGGHPGTRANVYGPNPAQGREGIGSSPWTYSMFLEGPEPHLLRVVRVGP
jgi:hypothetical protein